MTFKKVVWSWSWSLRRSSQGVFVTHLNKSLLPAQKLVFEVLMRHRLLNSVGWDWGTRNVVTPSIPLYLLVFALTFGVTAHLGGARFSNQIIAHKTLLEQKRTLLFQILSLFSGFLPTCLFTRPESLSWSQQGFWQPSFCRKHNLGSLCFDWGNLGVLLFNASLKERGSITKLKGWKMDSSLLSFSPLQQWKETSP